MNKRTKAIDSYDSRAGNNSKSNKFRLYKIINRDNLTLGVMKLIDGAYGHELTVHTTIFIDHFPDNKIKERYTYYSRYSCKNCSLTYNRYCSKYSPYRPNKSITRRAIRGIAFVLLRRLKEIDCECENYDSYLLVNSLHRM